MAEKQDHHHVEGTKSFIVTQWSKLSRVKIINSQKGKITNSKKLKDNKDEKL